VGVGAKSQIVAVDPTMTVAVMQVNNLLTASFNRSTAAEGMLQLQIDLLHP